MLLGFYRNYFLNLAGFSPYMLTWEMPKWYTAVVLNYLLVLKLFVCLPSTYSCDEYAQVHNIFSQNAFDAVMHFAAVAYVGESTLDPLK